MSEIGRYLKELRGNRSLREVEKLSGVSHTYLSSLEKGEDPRTGKERKPTPETLLKLAKTYNPSQYDPLYRELMYLAGHMVPPAVIDFGGDADLKLIEYWFEDLEKNCSYELKRLEDHYRPTFGENFTITPGTLKTLMYTVPFTQGTLHLIHDILALIEKVKKNKNQGIELTSIIGKQEMVLYKGHSLTNQDQERILSMLDALFPEYTNKPK
jgi:transcriptional regulator with XRE-family HTH domain